MLRESTNEVKANSLKICATHISVSRTLHSYNVGELMINTWEMNLPTIHQSGFVLGVIVCEFESLFADNIQLMIPNGFELEVIEMRFSRRHYAIELMWWLWIFKQCCTTIML